MTVSKRDTIIIAVLVNVGLLAILLMTAINNNEDEMTQDTTEITQPIVQAEKIPVSEPYAFAAEPATPVDEVDTALTQYSGSQILSTQTEDQDAPNLTTRDNSEPVSSAGQKDFVEVTVKKGDSLDKIARANKTTIDEIRKASNLSNDKLSIGQVLKVPVNKIVTKKSTATPVKDTVTTGATYYTIKSGDSPWKVAKQFGVNYEDVLKLNNMTAEKARNLKPGDQIRIR